MDYTCFVIPHCETMSACVTPMGCFINLDLRLYVCVTAAWRGLTLRSKEQFFFIIDVRPRGLRPRFSGQSFYIYLKKKKELMCMYLENVLLLQFGYIKWLFEMLFLCCMVWNWMDMFSINLNVRHVGMGSKEHITLTIMNRWSTAPSTEVQFHIYFKLETLKSVQSALTFGFTHLDGHTTH